MEWSEILIPPEFAITPTLQGPPPPERALQATTEDRRPLQVVQWGDGTERAPLQLFVRVGLQVDHLEGAPLPVGPARLPTWLELQEAVNESTPAGAVMSTGGIVSEGAGAPLQPIGEAPWAGLQLFQAGAIGGTDAASRNIIVKGV